MSSVSTSLWISFVIVAGIQFLFFIPSAILKTEKYYDLSGSITYQTAILVALLWRHENDSLEFLTARQIIAAAGVMIWSVRLGVFLFLRVLRVKDVRFDNLKQNPIKFIGPWIIQVIWIYITALAVFIVLGNSGLESQSRTLIWSDWIGMIIWIFGFTVEVTADTQKMIFKNSNPNDFIRTGIWKYCRYANYNGEMTLWIGMFILCAHGFIESWQWIGIISPIFVCFLIIFVSGVPLLEASSEKRYGERQDYKEYKKNTSKYFLWFPKFPIVMENQLFQLKFTAKSLERQSKKCQKEQEQEKQKVKKALAQGNIEGARIYSENAIRKKTEELNLLRLASRIDGVASRVQTAVTMRKVTANMAGVVKGMEKAMQSMNLEQISMIMDKFEKQFEDLDVQTATMEGAMGQTTSTMTPQDQVDSFMQQVADENGLELKLSLPGAASNNISIEKVEKEDELGQRLARLRNS